MSRHEHSWKSEDHEQDGKDIETPQGSGEDQREQYPSYDADIPGPAQVFLSFIRKKEMHKPREQHSSAH